MIVEHPDGGHCNTDGMTEECGCICYGCGLIKECNERIKALKVVKRGVNSQT